MSIRPLRKRQQLRAVHDNDLEAFLESLGMLEAVKSGHSRCEVCGQLATLQNLGAVLPIGNRVGLSCDSESCLEQALSLVAGGE